MSDRITIFKPYYNMSTQESLLQLKSQPEGISAEEARRRLELYGSNELKEGKNKSFFEKLIAQFKDVMIIILLIAAIISGLLGELTDTFIILAIVIINAIIGVTQESKAEKALEALKKMSSPKAKVIRDGQVIVMDVKDIVTGDIVLLEAGDYVPADLRLLEAVNLKIDESSLTGESFAVTKITDALEKTDLVAGDRINMAYSSCIVTNGRGTGVVVATGMDTEVGNIAKYITHAETEQTPLQKKLAELGKYLSIAILAVALVVFVVGLINGRKLDVMFLTAVSLAVAAIPEGMVAIVTIVLAMGVQKMSRKNAIVRKLPAVETLGCTEVICSDKTGTLTQNKMTVKKIYVNGELAESASADHSSASFETAAQIMSLCNDSRLKIDENDRPVLAGDPTETALVEYSFISGYNMNELAVRMPRKSEIPFDSGRKLMTTVNSFNGTYRILTKGASDILVTKCSGILTPSGVTELSDGHRQSINLAASKMAQKALRVLALAYKDVDDIPDPMTTENVENDLVFAGLVGMIDPPRPEAALAVKTCKLAGIKAIMITGDHRDTAAAIAMELGIINNESQVITGADLDKISDEDFLLKVRDYKVYARVSPEHKVRIVQAWRDNTKVVAMTGDGVNDAPALKKADIGIGMGITGTDVSKGVSDMVLADDNFATIVDAVKEGRKIYSNIRKAIQYLLSCNTGEVLTMFIATLLNWQTLLPIHLLWVNLVTDAFPALALGVEPEENDIMLQKPRKANSSIFSGGVGINLIYQGIVEGMIVLATYFVGWKLYSESIGITMSFMTLGLIQLAHSYNVRSNDKSIFRLGVFSNKYLNMAAILAAVLQVSIVVIPPLNILFKVEHLDMTQWAIVVGSSLLIIPVVEIVKLFSGIKKRKTEAAE